MASFCFPHRLVFQITYNQCLSTLEFFFSVFSTLLTSEFLAVETEPLFKVTDTKSKSRA